MKHLWTLGALALFAIPAVYVGDDGAPASTGAGDVQLWVNQRSGERSQFSGQLRILPPQ